MRMKKTIKKQSQSSNELIQKDEKLKMYRRFIFILCMVSFTLYANTIKNGYCYDDFEVITTNKLVTQGVFGISWVKLEYYQGRAQDIKSSIRAYRPIFRPRSTYFSQNLGRT